MLDVQMCIIFSLTTEVSFDNASGNFFHNDLLACFNWSEGISPNHTLFLNPWYDLDYQRRVVRRSLEEFTETLSWHAMAAWLQVFPIILSISAYKKNFIHKYLDWLHGSIP